MYNFAHVTQTLDFMTLNRETRENSIINCMNDI